MPPRCGWRLPKAVWRQSRAFWGPAAGWGPPPNTCTLPTSVGHPLCSRRRLPARPTQEVTAAYAYQGQRASDLSFAAGDVIVVTRKKANGWWVGHVRGRDPATAGEFPSNYVR